MPLLSQSKIKNKSIKELLSELQKTDQNRVMKSKGSFGYRLSSNVYDQYYFERKKQQIIKSQSQVSLGTNKKKGSQEQLNWVKTYENSINNREQEKLAILLREKKKTLGKTGKNVSLPRIVRKPIPEKQTSEKLITFLRDLRVHREREVFKREEYIYQKKEQVVTNKKKNNTNFKMYSSKNYEYDSVEQKIFKINISHEKFEEFLQLKRQKLHKKK